MKTSELTGIALDWAVAKCEGHNVFIKHAPIQVMYTPERKRSWYIYRPSTNWSQGGPIIEREVPMLMRTNGGDWIAQGSYDTANDKEAQRYYGPTPLVAAMRCYCCAKLGDTVDIPDELI